MKKADRLKKSLTSTVIATLVLAVGLALAACSSSRSSDAGAGQFSLGYLAGAQDFSIYVMESQGFLERYGLKPKKFKFLNPPGVHLMIAEGQVDIGFGGFTTMAIARAQGRDVIVVHGIFSPVNVVFVRRDSSLQSLVDLKEKKLGIFGGPGSTTFAFLAVIASKWYGLDIYRDVELITAPGPVLSNLLDRGEIDAALMGTMESIKFSADRKYRVLVDLSGEYQKRQGLVPAHVTVSTSEKFATEHPEIVKGFIRAFRDAVNFSKNDSEIWARYGATIGMNSEDEIDLLQQKMTQNTIQSWDSEQIETQNQYLRLVQSVLGDRVLSVIPEGLIRNDFNP